MDKVCMYFWAHNLERELQRSQERCALDVEFESLKKEVDSRLNYAKEKGVSAAKKENVPHELRAI